MGELFFMQAHDGDLTRIDGLEGDFIWHETGEKLELKTDTWSMAKTPNYFMERYSDRETKSPGGPWQALSHGCDLFVYFYVQDLTYFVFDTRKLVGALEKIIPRIEPTLITNRSWVTEGYRVPRAMLSDIATEHKLVVKKKKVRARK